MRNVKLDGQAISNLKSLDWPDRLPTSGILTATFITSKARRTMTVIESKKLAALQAQFSKPMMSDTERLNIANMLAPHHVFLCSQIKSMLANFSMGDERVEAAVMMFTRALDTDECLDQLMEPLHERERRLFYEALSFYGFYVFANATGNNWYDRSHVKNTKIQIPFKTCSLQALLRKESVKAAQCISSHDYQPGFTNEICKRVHKKITECRTR